MRRVTECAFALGVLYGMGCGDTSEDGNAATVTTISRAVVRDQDEGTEEELRELRQREVIEWNDQRSAGWELVDTRISPSGQVIDYVAAETLYPDDPAAPFATPPFEIAPQLEIPESDGIPAIRQGGTEIAMEPSLRPPPGTIPVLRENFAAYVEDPDGTQSLSEFISNLVEPANVAANGHLYADQTNNVDHTDTNAFINLWRYGETVFQDDMSLMQVAVSCISPGGSLRHRVEAGFNVHPELYGDTKLHLFSFFSIAGPNDPDQDYRVGYNLMVKGFVQWSGATSFPGATIASDTLSSVNGPQYECLLEYTL